MTTTDNTCTEVVDDWLSSNLTARISGLDLKPIPHPILPNSAQCVVKGQASVFFLRQYPHGHTWLLKKFAPSRRPSDLYLEAVTRCLPGGASFFTCTQRRLLTARHLDWRSSEYRDANLAGWLEGTVLMPKVPGSPWASIGDSLRDGEAQMPTEQRLRVSLSLVDGVLRLEAASCAHRDLSSTNVFLAGGYRIYLIDWDCMYHPQLPFQSNTTAGTMGYIAPFMRVSQGSWDASRSWRPCADRFAMAVLIAEFMLIGPDSPPPREDGTLFSQTHLDEPRNPFVEEQVEALRRISRVCGDLLATAVSARSYQACPSPQEWQSALRRELRFMVSVPKDRTLSRSSVQHPCAGCGSVFLINAAKLIELQDRGKAILCSPCLSRQLREWIAARQERDEAHPQIACEHCQRTVRLARAKLDDLRSKAKPILCSVCLGQQLRRWEVERQNREREMPRIVCAKCGKEARVRREKLLAIRAKGRVALCPACLTTALQSHAARLRGAV